VNAITYQAKSTVDEHGSIPTQRADCRALAEREGMTVVAEHHDEAASAFEGNRGPGLARAMADCERLAPCALVVQHSDRLARGDGVKARHLVELVWWAQKHGVTIRSVQDDSTFSNPLLTFAMGERNTEDSRRKAAAVKSGLRRRAEGRDGKGGKLVGGPRPYGYRWAEDPDDRRVSILVVEPEEARVVLRIFEDTRNGLSQSAIAKALNHERVPTATGKTHWTQSSVRRVLVNPVNRGAITLNGEEFPGAHDAIVPDDLWFEAERLRSAAARTKGNRGGRHPKGSHLFVKGLLRCGLCGSAMIPRTNQNRSQAATETYFCDSRRVHGTGHCPQTPVERATVDAAMLAELQRRYVDMDATRDRLAAKLSAEADAASTQVQAAEREALKAGERLARVQRAFQDGFIEPVDYREQADPLREEQAATAAALQQARDHAARLSERGPVLDAEAEMYRRLADLRAAVVDGIKDAAGLDGLRRLLAHTFEHVDYLPDGASYGETVGAPVAGQACLLPVLSERVFEGIDDEATAPRVRLAALSLETDPLCLQT
jgi:site-specific DNA recombinase